MMELLLGLVCGLYVGIALVTTVVYKIVPHPIDNTHPSKWEALYVGLFWPIMLGIVVQELA